MRVVYIITKLELGGAQKVCLELFKSLNSLSVNTYATNITNTQAWLISGTQGVLVSQVQHNSQAILLASLEREVGFFDLRALQDLVCAIKKIKKIYPDLMVHTHSTKAGLLGRWAAWFAGVPTRVHTVHGFGFHAYQSKIGYIVTYLLELLTSIITTRYITVSGADVRTGLRMIPNFFKKHTMIRASVDFDSTMYTPDYVLASKKSSSEKLIIFGTVACFKKQKNLFDLLRAFLHVHSNYCHTRLEILGDGLLRPEIEAWIASHQLTSVVKLWGWQDVVEPIMSRWDVFTLSSLWEGLPCAVVTARFLKLPVISYNIGGMSDIIFNNKNGFLCEPKDIAALARYMCLLVEDSELCKRLSNFDDDLREFTLDVMIAKHIELYKTL